MVHSKKLLKFLFLLCLSLSFANTRANDDFSNEELSSLVEIREEDRYLVYGDYAEIEISAEESINLSFRDDVVPFGMELEKVDEKSYLLFGAPQFVGKLCFLVDAQTLRGKSSVERLCLYGDPNEEIQYPVYTEERFLKSVKTYENFSVSFGIEDYDLAVFQSMVTPIQSGLDINRNHKGQITLEGSLTEAGIYEFVVKSKETNSEVTVYKQFVLEVTESNTDNSYQCAPGYYWDDYLNYCVQASGRTCGYGTWYDHESNSCRAYRTVNYCRAGTYWDHWLNRCVISTAKRCPINYEWDRYYGRCVRLPYTCSYNQRYDYSLRACVRIYRTRTCSVGYHWSSYSSRCVRNARTCYRGEYWNGYSCVRTRRVCRSGNYYDPIRGRCTVRGTVRTCSPGYRWNSRSRSCVGTVRTGERVCPRGQRYSGRRGSCVGHNPRRVERHRNRIPHRRVVTRPDRPRNGGGTTRPDRPRNGGGTTRPDRPRRPSTPTTRPDRPRRPSTPTTRPDRPRRPSTPTTRPDRPRNGGGTTRPDRPRRSSGSSSSGSSTRPSRPSRDSGSTARPSRPSRGSSGGTVSRPSRPSRGGNDGGGQRRRRPKPE